MSERDDQSGVVDGHDELCFVTARFCQDQPVRTSQVTVWPPPSTGKSDHRAESASGGGGETVDGVSAYEGLSNQPG